MSRTIPRLAGWLLVLWLSACVSQPAKHKELADLPPALQDDYRRLREAPASDRGLRRMRFGLKAYRLGYKKIAAETFDKVLPGIETIYADSEKAAPARSLWYEEGMKDFKGEPYERVMAYFYRGLLYIEDGDLENARACFKAGLLQDSFAEEKTYRADFALMIFMEGWCSRQLKDEILAEESFFELKRLRPDFKIPRKRENVLIIAETGTSPIKVADGVGRYELKFRPGRGFKEKKVFIAINNGRIKSMFPMEDIAWQSMTRGGRALDKILKGQAFFRPGAETVATLLTKASVRAVEEASPVFEESNQAALAGEPAGLTGAAHLLSATRVKAKTRYWDNLPEGVFVYSRSLPRGKHTADLSYADEKGRPLTRLRQEFIFKVNSEGPTMVYYYSPSIKL